MNDASMNVGGWNASKMRTFCNKRIFNALPIVWQSMIKSVKINASAGNQSTEIITSEDKIYLESLVALINIQDSTYQSEGEHIDWFTSNLNCAKFMGAIIADDAEYFLDSVEPSTVSTNTVKVGDVWRPSNRGACYICVSLEDYNLMRITPNDAPWTGTKTKDNMKVWVYGSNWRLRSPNIENSTDFHVINTGGGMGSESATVARGVCPCFSI